MTYSFGDTQDIILFEMYSYFRYSEDTTSIDQLSIEKRTSQNVSRLFAKRAIDNLLERELIEIVDPADGTYALLAEGILYVEKQMHEPMSCINLYEADKAKDARITPLPPENDEPDEWEPLPVDRETTEYNEAIAALSEAIDVIAGNNGYAETEPVERNHIVESLKQGQKIITDLCPSRAQVQAMVIQHLSYLARKFAESTLGEVAKAAAIKIVAWLASLI